MKNRIRFMLVLAAALLLLAVVMINDHPWTIFWGVNWLKSSITQHLQTDFVDINQKLQNDFGMHMSSKTLSTTDWSCYNSLDALDTNHDDTCIGSIPLDATPITADGPFIDNWRKSSPGLETWLLQNGWHKTWNEKQPIAEILDKPQNETSIGVNYEKKHGIITCTLSFMWIQPHTPNQLSIREECAGSLRP